MSHETCAACGCDIVDNRTADGAAVSHGSKLYCFECAAMILSDEDLGVAEDVGQVPMSSIEKNTAPATNFDEDALAEEQFDSPTMKPAAPAPLSAPTGSGIRRGVNPSPRRDSKAVSVSGQRRPSTRTAATPPPAAQSAGSRRGGTASIGRRDNTAGGARPDRSEKDTASGRDANRGRQRKADSTGVYIGLAVGGLILMIAAYLLLSPSKSGKPGKTKAKEEFIDNDQTPSDVYAQRGKDYLDKNDRIHAVEMYRKAAGRAAKEGNDPQAVRYNMQIVTIEKASTIR